jgi:hypothetical protein
MVFSDGIIDSYARVGIENIIVERNNLYDTKLFESFEKGYARIRCSDGKEINLIFSDSILFQQFQRSVHGEQSLDRYLEKALQYAKTSDISPLYSNDAEVFNFRPGRFKEEAVIEQDEWINIRKLINNLSDDFLISCLNDIIESLNLRHVHNLPICNISNLLPVKKQKKYNIFRWAVTGRDDHKINKYTYLLYKNGYLNRSKRIKFYLNAFSSDYRTHITDRRWNEFWHGKHSSNYEKLSKDLEFYDLSSKPQVEKRYIREVIGNSELILDKKKGLSIFSYTHNKDEIFTTFEHGNFQSIELGADFYSALIYIEEIENNLRFTDLVPFKVYVLQKPNKTIINGFAKHGSYYFKKQYILTSDKLEIFLSIKSNLSLRRIIRVGNFCISPLYLLKGIGIKNGSNKFIDYPIDRYVDHFEPVSRLISCEKALGGFDGDLKIISNDSKAVIIQNDPTYSPGLFGLKHKADANGNFTRIELSLSELDDTAKKGEIDYQTKISISINK